MEPAISCSLPLQVKARLDRRSHQKHGTAMEFRTLIVCRPVYVRELDCRPLCLICSGRWRSFRSLRPIDAWQWGQTSTGPSGDRGPWRGPRANPMPARCSSWSLGTRWGTSSDCRRRLGARSLGDRGRFDQCYCLLEYDGSADEHMAVLAIAADCTSDFFLFHVNQPCRACLEERVCLIGVTELLTRHCTEQHRKHNIDSLTVPRCRCHHLVEATQTIQSHRFRCYCGELSFWLTVLCRTCSLGRFE